MRDLGTLEAAVMQRLWAWDREVTVRKVVEDLERERDIAYTTVMTVMDNLHRKGLVRRTKVGRAFRYAAVETREAHTAALLEDVLGGANDRTATLLRFIDNLEPAEQAELRRLLDADEGPRS
ncbi:BlaI/MecI/CopY family transcriptional regulator [Nocardioides aequoreus]|uniref:BlaI/MecI/CopY family transcriptional regulator n=1 Tax=Nocardioides aequoreus TaxID=397278 RepID=UPI0004C35BD1|nr:BlaI/MecI/CopY family transcriptional regulator [Nocardioides aequoreus]